MTQVQPLPPAGHDSFSFLKLIAEASVVVVGLCFVAGWSYLASYYRTFGVDPIELDIPIAVAATMALHMLYNSMWPLIVMAVLTTVFVAAAYYAGVQASHRWWVLAALVVFMFSSATAALIRGRHNANLDMTEESSNLPLVAFSSKSEAAKIGPPEQPACVGYENFGAMDCKLVLHSKGVYFFFRPIPKKVTGAAEKLDLFMLPDTEVLGVHIQRSIDLSEFNQ